MFIHILLRILLFFPITFVGMIIGLVIFSSSETNYFCATGEIYKFVLSWLLGYVIWLLYLLIEGFYYHRKRKFQHRNSDLWIIFVFSILFLVLFILFLLD